METHGIPVPPHDPPLTELSKSDMSAVMVELIQYLSVSLFHNLFHRTNNLGIE